MSNTTTALKAALKAALAAQFLTLDDLTTLERHNLTDSALDFLTAGLTLEEAATTATELHLEG
jgi:hypothetical protein